MQCTTYATSHGGRSERGHRVPAPNNPFRSNLWCRLVPRERARQVRGGSAAVPGHLANLRSAEDGNAHEGNLHRA